MLIQGTDAAKAARRVDVARTDRRGAARRDDVAVDVSTELAEVGLSGLSAWLTAAALFGGGGALVATIYLIDSEIVPRPIFFIACLSILVAIAMTLGARRMANSEAAAHARLLIGVSTYTVGAWVAPEAAPVFVLFPLMTLPTPCYIYGRRFIIPYVGAALTVELVVMLSINGPARVTHAIVATFAMGMVAIAMILAKQRIRTLARRNRRLAYVDPLTGVANIRALRERLVAESTGDGRESEFALFAIDLDNFKQVNDRFDHSFGDTVLRAVAQAIADAVEPGDFVARRGGDEFSIVVSRAGERDLDKLRERIVAAIREVRMRTCPQVTPSAGVAYVLACPDGSPDAVVERADEVLKQTKHIERERRGELTEAEPAIERTNVSAGGAAVLPLARAAQGPDAPVDRRVVPQSRAPKTRGHRGRDFAALFESDLDAAWISAAAMVGPVAVLLAAITAAGSLAELPMVVGFVVAGSIAVIGLGGVFAGLHHLRHAYLHAAAVTVYALIATMIVFAGNDGVALVELFPMMVLQGFIVFRAPVALLYLVLGQSLFVYFVITGDAPSGTIGAAVGTAIVLIVGGLMSKLRGVTVRFARTSRELSERDGLTGLANMRAFEHRVRNIADLGRSRALKPLLIAIDLDEFKPVNDLCGHSTGDRTLMAVAAELTAAAGRDDLVVRRGGDEFFIVQNDIGSESPEQTARRIGEAVEGARSRVCPGLLATASVAIVHWPPGELPVDLLHKADRALHEAKATRRSNRSMKILA